MKTKPIAAWKLERYFLGELPPAEMQAVETLLRENPEMNRDLDQIRLSNLDILQQFPPAAAARQIAAPYEKKRQQRLSEQGARRRNWKTWLIASPLLASAVIVTVVLLNEKPQNRIKGSEAIKPSIPQLIIYKKTTLGIVTLKNNASVRSGDLLQLAYVAAGKKFGVLISVDGNHQINLHFPEHRNSSSRLHQGKTVVLPTAYELDAAPQYECFYFITAPEEIDAGKMMNVIAAASQKPDFPQNREIELPAAYSQYFFLLKKGDTL